MSSISLKFFGTPHVFREGAPVHLSRRKAMALLAYLAVSGQPFNRDVLAALFWPELGHRRARANLRQSIFTLNKTLGPGWLDNDADDVLLSSQSGLEVDVVHFRSLQAEVEAHNHPFPHLCDACIHNLTQAAELYRSDFMAGFALPDAPEFDTWQLMQRESLQSELSTVLERLALIFALAGHRQYDLAIHYARRRLALDPLHEPAHRTLMRLYAESGDRAAAVRQFEECQRILAEELGVDPAAETTDLIAQIRAGEVGYEADSEGSEGVPADRMPTQSTSFIGREKELAQITTRLANPDCSLLTVVGPGGSGKTRLAIQAASVQTSNFRDGVHFVDLAPVGSPELMATTILRSLDAPDSGATDPRRRLCDHLRAREMLLVLDNYEHLLPAVDLLPELLRAAPKIKLLVTSRERLNVRKEWLEPLEGLSVPPGPAPGLPAESPEVRPALMAFDATRLFVSRMHQLRPNYVPEASSLSDEDASTIAAICRLLEGMPLAIELAAGWTRTLSLAELQQEIQHNLDLLHTSMRDVPPRLRSMRAAFDHSWNLLAPEERRIMRQMSVFRGGCTRHAAEQIVGATLDELAALVDKSWLRLDKNRRYSIHELARQYCEEKLEATVKQTGEDAVEGLRRRYCTYYGTYASGIVGLTNFRPATLADIMAEFNNLLAALHIAVEHLEVKTAYDTFMAFFFAESMLGWLRYAIEIMHTISAKLEDRLANKGLVEPKRTEVANVLAGVRFALASEYSQLSLYSEAEIYSSQLLSLISDMQPGRARVYWTSWQRLIEASQAYSWGNFRAAEQLTYEALALFDEEKYDCFLYGRERGVPHWKASVYFRLGRTYWALGEYAASEASYTHCLALYEVSSERRERGNQLGRYAQMVQVTGDYMRAEELAREGLHLSELCGDRIGIALGHLSVGMVLAVQERYDSARQHLYKSLETGRYSGRIDLVMRSLCQLGRIELAEDRPEDARHYFEEALVAFEQSGAEHDNALAEVWLGLGWCSLAEEDLGQAQSMFIKTQNQSGVMAYQVQESNYGLALVYLSDSKIDEAVVLLKQVIGHPATAQSTRESAQQQLSSINSRS